MMKAVSDKTSEPNTPTTRDPAPLVSSMSQDTPMFYWVHCMDN